MQKYTRLFMILFGFIVSWGQAHSKNSPDVDSKALSLYQQMKYAGEPLPKADVFLKAFQGYQKLKANGKCQKKVLAVADFRLSSAEKRLWVIDLEHGKTLHHTWVAHGRNTGNEYAQSFSNTPNSHQSSLGFYITQQTYFGKHGLSLRLEGVEHGINHKAYQRAIVMHGAEYAEPSFIEKHGRLGRSYGCPAVPQKEHKPIISALTGRACLFIYYPDQSYEQQSQLIGGSPSPTDG